MLLVKHLWSEILEVAYLNIFVIKHLHVLARQCVLCHVFNEILQSEVMSDSPMREGASFHNFLVHAHQEKRDDSQLKIHPHHLK